VPSAAAVIGGLPCPATAKHLAGKLSFFTLAFVIPMLLHPMWTVLLLYVLSSFVLGVVYSEHASVWAGLASHFRWLRRMGAPAGA
jgi:hypothetical protein